MKKFIFLAFVALIASCPLIAQFTTVNYDFERNWFNEGQALPAEESMIFKGMIPDNTEILELSILSAKRPDVLYKAVWNKSSSNELILVVPFKLRASETYDVEMKFYKNCSSADRERLLDDLAIMLDTYIDVNLTGGKSIKFKQKTKKIMREMNELLQSTSEQYRSKNVGWTPAFSNLVALKLDQIEKVNLTEDYNKKAEAANKKGMRKDNKNSLLNELKTQVNREIQQIFNSELYKLESSRFIDDYATEEKVNSLALNIGYGGTYISGDWDDFNYGASPYLGLAFPLGNSVLGSKFLSNSSITLGVFLQNFEDNAGEEITGFIVDRPFYVGLDHKLFKFIRINAGATFLEETISTVGSDVVSKNIMIRPFVGLSARVDLAIGFGK